MLEDEVGEVSSHDKAKTKGENIKYNTHSIQLWAYLAVFVLFLLSASFLLSILFVGSLNAQTILREKPDIIAKAGYRRTINEGLVFW
jgi:hypothetical protein